MANAAQTYVPVIFIHKANTKNNTTCQNAANLRNPLKKEEDCCRIRDVLRWQIILCGVGGMKEDSYMTVYGGCNTICPPWYFFNA